MADPAFFDVDWSVPFDDMKDWQVAAIFGGGFVAVMFMFIAALLVLGIGAVDTDLPDDGFLEQFIAEVRGGRRWIKRAVLIVNPVSGGGAGQRVAQRWEETLTKAGVEVSLLTSKYAGDGNRLGSTAFDAVDPSLPEQVCLIFGGDGHVYDCINGVEKAGLLDKVAFGIVPVGTGNGVATSIGCRSPSDAFAGLTLNTPKPIDLMRCSWRAAGTDRTSSAVLSVAWGATADHDHYTEDAWRWMGAARLLIAPAVVIARLRTYTGTLRFKEGKQLRLGSHELCTPTTMTGADGHTEWLVVKDTFFFVHCCNVPWVGHDVQIAPPARPADGLMTVVIMRPPTRLNAVRMFLAAESGRHVQLAQVEVFQCTGLRIEPDSPDGHIAVDGEAIPCVPIDVEIATSAARVHYFGGGGLG